MRFIHRTLTGLFAVLLLAFGLAACDNGTYTVGTHSELGKLYEMHQRDASNGGECTIAQGATSMTGTDFLTFSDPARNGQQYGLINCNAYDWTPRTMLGPPGGPGILIYGNVKSLYLVTTYEVPLGSIISSPYCKVRYHMNGHPGKANWYTTAWTSYFPGQTFEILKNTNVKAVEWRNLTGYSCSVSRVDPPSSYTNPPWV